MTGRNLARDERTVAVENASYRLGYMVLAFGILLSVAYRGLVLQEASWDLLALVVVSGLVTAIYQGGRTVLTRRWAMVAAGTTVLAALIGAALVFLR
jgi:hypothetical protein